MRFIKRRNDSLLGEARRANLERIRLALRVLAPVHLAIIYLLLKHSPESHQLWSHGLIFIHTVLLLLKIILWVIISQWKTDKIRPLPAGVFLGCTLVIIISAGIVITLVEQVTAIGVVPFTLMNILIGTLFVIRPGEAILLFAAIYFALSFALDLAGPSQLLLSSRLHGLISAALGLTLSLITWCSFYKSKKQEEVIKNQQFQLEQMAYHDPLTGLPNRRFLDEIVKKDLALARRGYYRSCLMVLDIDDFKEVNDSYGHPVGDRVLKQLAELLKANVRDTDTVARVGGEEFVILLANTTLNDGLAVAESLRLLIQNYTFKVGKPGVKLTVSLGVSLLKGDGELSYYELADKALYEAKAQGKNRVRLSITG